MGLICKLSASFICLLSAYLLKPFEFESSLNKPGWQGEMHVGGSRGKGQTVCRMVKETSCKEIVQKEEAVVYHKFDPRTMSLFNGRGNSVHSREYAPGGGEAGCLHRQVVKAKADRELQ